MGTSAVWRLTAVAGGLLAGVGLDHVDGTETQSGWLLLGVGVGLMVAALVRD